MHKQNHYIKHVFSYRLKKNLKILKIWNTSSGKFRLSTKHSKKKLFWWWCGDDSFFCGMVGRRKTFSLISSRGRCQRYSLSWISNTSEAGFETAQSLSSGLVEWSCEVVINATSQSHKTHSHHTKSSSNRLVEHIYTVFIDLRYEITEMMPQVP